MHAAPPLTPRLHSRLLRAADRWLPGRRPLLLALQGGGAHGAFTWGVLDRLLEEPGVRLAALSGASAGALNAAVAASGWASGGARGARQGLEAFWRRVADAANSTGMGSSGLLAGDHSPGYLMLRTLSRVASPYQLNPSGFNPLAAVLEQSIDFDALRHPSAPRLFVSATSVHSGRLRLFDNADVSPAALQASACLPMLFHAVAVDGEYHWDGGYSSNPPLLPLLRHGGSRDLLLVQLKDSWSERVPTSAEEIAARASEITFNAGLLRELELYAELRPRLARRTRLHRITADDAFNGFGQSSSLNADWGFLTELRGRGRERASAWLASHGTAVGRRATLPWETFRVPGLGG